MFYEFDRFEPVGSQSLPKTINVTWNLQNPMVLSHQLKTYVKNIKRQPLRWCAYLSNKNIGLFMFSKALSSQSQSTHFQATTVRASSLINWNAINNMRPYRSHEGIRSHEVLNEGSSCEGGINHIASSQIPKGFLHKLRALTIWPNMY